MGLLSNLWVKIKGDSTHLDSTLKKSKSGIKTWAKNIGTVIAAGFAVAAAAVLAFGKKLVDLGGQAQGVEAAFKKLNEPDLLNNLRKATRGTVDNLVLMTKAIQAKNFKIPLDQLATYFEFATKRAIQTGESVDYLVDSIITGIGRKSVLVMDNLGISAIELQNEVKKTGDFATAAGVIIRRELTSMGDVADTAGTKIAALATTWANFKVSLGKKLVNNEYFGYFLRGLEAISNWLKGPYANLSKEQIEAEQQKLTLQREQLLLGREAILQEREKSKRADAYNDTLIQNTINLGKNKKELDKINAILLELGEVKGGKINAPDTKEALIDIMHYVSQANKKLVTPFVYSKPSSIRPAGIGADTRQEIPFSSKGFETTKNLVEDLQGTFADMFTAISSGSGTAFEDMAKAFGRSIQSMVAQLLAAKLVMMLLNLIAPGAGTILNATTGNIKMPSFNQTPNKLAPGPIGGIGGVQQHQFTISGRDLKTVLNRNM